MTDDIKTDGDRALALIVKRNKKIEKKKQVIAFAKTALGCDKFQAKMVRKFGSKHFKLADDGLAFKGEGGNLVDIRDPQVAKFFQKAFSFLPKTEGTETAVELDAYLITRAKTNQTARGELFRKIHGDKPKSEEAASYAAMTKLLAGEEAPVAKKTAANGLVEKSKNPFIGLRDKSGQIDPVKMAKVESFIKAAGSKAAAAVARSAGLRLDGTEIPERYR
jgi:hypothetical protein